MTKQKNSNYSPIEEWKWRQYDGKHKADLDEFIAKHRNDLFFIGTDSQSYSKKNVTVFTTALIAYTMHKGGSVILHRDRVPRMEHLRQRLLMEAMRSLEIAWYLNERIPSESLIGIHLDVNQSLKYKSGQYKDELVGLVVGQGFKALVKPDSWAANSVADSRC